MSPLASYLEPLPLIAVLRGITPEEVADIGAALTGNGFRILEVPLNSPRPYDSIAAARARSRRGAASSARAPCCGSRTSRACATPAAASS